MEGRLVAFGELLDCGSLSAALWIEDTGCHYWYKLIFFAIPFLVFAALTAREEKRETFRLNLDVDWQEEGCLLVGSVMDIVSISLSALLPAWAALPLGVPATLVFYGSLVLLFKLLVLLLLHRHK